MQCAGDDWDKRKSNQPMDSQLMGCKRRARDRFVPSSYEEEVVRQTEHRWDTPCKCALLGSDEPDNTTSETQDFGLPRDGYTRRAQSGLFIENDSPETAGFLSQKLEDTVGRLRRDVAAYRKELRLAGGQDPANHPQSRDGRNLLPRQFPDTNVFGKI